jgi:putative Ca2+/H+ antiporter (TMEM165/GDT1 family)
MELKAMLAIFGTVFLAELGDKTQLAVFLAASAALVLSSAIGVAAGSMLSHYVNTRYLSILAGVGFIAIGAWTLWSALRGA